MITKRTFIQAAEIVRAIREGHWTHESPQWSIPWSSVLEIESSTQGNLNPDYVRAVWTAEAFIQLFHESNPRFDQARFLYACGLGPKPAPKQRVS